MVKLFLLILIVVSLSISIAALWYRVSIKGLKKRRVAILDKVDFMLSKADAGKDLKRYNSVVHIILSVFCLLLGYLIARQRLSIFSAVACGAMAGMLPTMGIKILESINSGRLSRESMNFISTFTNYAATGFDIFSSFRQSEPELNEPFRTIIKNMLRQYDDKVDPIMCLKSASNAIESEEIRAFFRTLMYQLVEGGDYVKLSDELTAEIGDLVDLDEQENTEDNVLRYGIYVLIAVDITILFNFLKSNQSSLIIGTLYGEIALTIHFLLAMLLIVFSFIKPRR